MKCFPAFALIVASTLSAQTDFSKIYGQANKPTVPLQNPMDAYEQAMRIKLMQEQQADMAAQREAMGRQLIEANYKRGFEDGLKKGFQDGSEATYKVVKENMPSIGQTIIRNLANLIFDAENPDQFRDLITKFEGDLVLDPGDKFKKAMLILYKARLAELIPPAPVVKPTKKGQKKVAVVRSPTPENPYQLKAQ